MQDLPGDASREVIAKLICGHQFEAECLFRMISLVNRADLPYLSLGL